MNELQVFSNPEFGQIRTITEKGKTLFCGNDVANALGYKRPKDAIAAHCKGAVKRRLLTEGGPQYMNFIPEGDIYRLAAKSELPGAERFESWIFDEVLPTIRKTGAYSIKPMTDYQQKMIETRERNSRIQASRILTQLARRYSGTTYEQVLNAHATKELTGEYLLPLPKLAEKTYSATEIGKLLGVSANKIGTLSSKHQMKTEQYGEWFKDKSPYCNKEVSSFRYYGCAIDAFRELLEKGE